MAAHCVTFCLIFLISLQFFGISKTSTTTEAGEVTTKVKVDLITFNQTAYAEVCYKENYKLKDVCTIDSREFKQIGIEKGVDTNFIMQKVFSMEIVNRLSKECPGGSVCDAVWDQIAVDSIKLFWRDAALRRRVCSVTPCISEILTENERQKSCKDLDRLLGFRAFRLLCHLTESALPDGDIMTCIDAAVELLQYNAADLRRNDSTVKNVCACSSKAKECVLPKDCRDMVKKYFCLSQRCNIDSESFLEKFRVWSWYFKNEKSLRKQFHIRSCNEEKIIMQNRSPFIVEVIQVYGGTQIVVAIIIAVIIACCTSLLACVIYRRYYRPRYTRDRNEYTEMKENSI